MVDRVNKNLAFHIIFYYEEITSMGGISIRHKQDTQVVWQEERKKRKLNKKSKEIYKILLGLHYRHKIMAS